MSMSVGSFKEYPVQERAARPELTRREVRKAKEIKPPLCTIINTAPWQHITQHRRLLEGCRVRRCQGSRVLCSRLSLLRSSFLVRTEQRFAYVPRPCAVVCVDGAAAAAAAAKEESWLD